MLKRDLLFGSARSLWRGLVIGALAVGWLNAPMPAAGQVLLAPTSFYEQLSAFPGTALEGGPPLFRWGPIDVHAHLSYDYVYETGALAEPGVPAGSVVQSFSPGITVIVGPHLVVNYSPVWIFYSNPLFHNTFEQLLSVDFTGHARLDDWSLGLTQTMNDTYVPLAETGTQTEERTYMTALSASYQMGSEWSLFLGASQSINEAPNYVSFDTWSGSAGLNDQFMPKLGGGISITGGYDSVSAGLDTVFESLQGSLHWLVGRKIIIQASGGVEDAEFLGAQSPSILTPIYSATIHYQLTQTTSLGIVAARTVTPSLFRDQVMEATTVSASLNQRLFKKLNLDISAGYASSPYQGIQFAVNPYVPLIHPIGAPITTAISTTREDTSHFFRISLSFPFLPRGQGSVFYGVNDNSSSQSAFTYSSTQIGFNLTYGF